ncbi:hypothetical protein FD755_016431, partial [Muntiacus reevesi]
NGLPFPSPGDHILSDKLKMMHQEGANENFFLLCSIFPKKQPPVGRTCHVQSFNKDFVPQAGGGLSRSPTSLVFHFFYSSPCRENTNLPSTAPHLSLDVSCSPTWCFYTNAFSDQACCPEVDQMLDMGFADQVEEILYVPYKKDSEDNSQTLHLAIKCHWTERAAVTREVSRVYSGYQGCTITFCETKEEAQELSQNAAIKQDAQNSDVGVLVATNVASHRLDIPKVDLVVQSSPPKDVEFYIHHSGQTGRAGKTGICICFYQHKQEYQLAQVEQKVGIKFKQIGIPFAAKIIKASSESAIRLLDSVTPTAIDHFKQLRTLLDQLKYGLCNNDLRCSIQMPNIRYVWKELKEKLGEDTDSKVKRMVFLKGKQGLSVTTEQPELEGPRERYRNIRGQSRSFRGQQSGGGNKSNRF